MGKLLILLPVGIAALALLAPELLRQVQARVPDDFQKLSGPERVARAREQSGAAARAYCEKAGLSYPPREIFIRAFKHEAQLELWAREDEGKFRHVTTWPVLKSSGKPGPKRREGDRQVPEGFYVIDRFNPESTFHLSLGLDYPNASDRIRSDAQKPGGDIFIHGKEVTVGCLPLGDRAIEELYLIALDTRDRGQHRIAVHIFPARMSGESWERFSREEAARRPAVAPFWRELLPAYAAFERDRLVPQVAVNPDGSYHTPAPR